MPLDLTNLPPGFYQGRAAPTIPSNPYDEGAALDANRRLQSSQDPLQVLQQMQMLEQLKGGLWQGAPGAGGDGGGAAAVGRAPGGGGDLGGFARLTPRAGRSRPGGGGMHFGT